ncbi:hypothetical protein CA3LBN_002407 [Candidozyma haemuli]|uniref:ARID domain-containing protein n=2 Tax=Candidozyma TaxID=3303203 RepID=A0ABX8I4V9_9ASCO|nr:hypothetical protein CA3LBN_002407 [[Candida] haemuloni]
MSNFWFKDDAFQGPGQQGDNDMVGPIFDEPLPGANNMAPQNHQKQPQSQHEANLFAQGDQGLGDFGMNQGNPGMDGKSPQMFMRNNEMMEGNGNSSQLDRQKQEQLLKMRQQIMHQQMVQNQQKAQHRQQPELAGARSSSGMNSEGQFQGNFPGNMGQNVGQNVNQNVNQNLNQNFGGFPGSGPGMAPQGAQNMQFMGNQMNQMGRASPAMNQQKPGNNQGLGPSLDGKMSANQNLSQNVSRESLEAQGPMGFQNQAPKNFMGQAPGGTPGAESFPGNAQGNPNAPKLTQSQFASLQYESLQMTLSDFMNRRGTPITQPPMVNNKKINLLILHLLTRKIGGAQVVLRHLQTLNQPSPQITDWTNLCKKLGLLEGIDVSSNLMAKQQIEKSVGTVYLQYILPYEQHDSTEEGRKELQARRVQFQRQLYMRFQQQQQQLQRQQGQQPQNQAANQNLSQRPQQLQEEQMKQQERNSPNVNQFQGPPAQSPHTGSMPTPGIPQSGRISQPVDVTQPSPGPGAMSRKQSQVGRSNQGSPAVLQSPYLQQQGLSRSGSVTQRSASAQSRYEASGTPRRSVVAEPAPEVVSGDPNTIKKYVPVKESTDTYGAVTLKSVSDISAEIELTKPVFLFAPELGSLNIHALTMSLKNYSVTNPGEIYSALNTLLVTTTDANCQFKVSDSPELLDALTSVGHKVLSQVTKTAGKPEMYEDVKAQAKGPIDSIFEKYVKAGEMQGEDIVYNVDSLTAELVEDEDSDIEVDDVFSPEQHESESPEVTNESTDYSDFNVPDFLTGLLAFREENKHYFSKIQTKSATDEQIFLVDLLITVTMTLRNLSFTGDSRALMASNASYRELIFKTIKAVFVHPDYFVFQRKRFCLLKDSLVMLDQIAFHMELGNLEEAFLTFLLVSAFAPKLNEFEDQPGKSCLIPAAQIDVHTYLPYGVDAFAKLLVREPKSRAYIQAVLTGSLNVISSSDHPSASSVVVTPEDHHEAKKMVMAYFKGDEQALKSGTLITRAFKLMMSIVPFTVSGIEFTRFALQRSSTTLQALFGAKLIIDLIPSDEVNSQLNRLPLWWLADNVQSLMFNFTKNTLSLITESVKFPRQTQEHKILSCVGTRSLKVVNSLLGNAANIKRALDDGEIQDATERENIENALVKLKALYRVQPESEFVLNTLLAASIDPDVAQEVVRLHGLLDQFQ